MNIALSGQDKLVLQAWLRSPTTLQDVENACALGMVGNVRFSNNAVRAFRLLWTWSAVRLHGDAGEAQARYQKRRGLAALKRRIQRAKGFIALLSQ